MSDPDLRLWDCPPLSASMNVAQCERNQAKARQSKRRKRTTRKWAPDPVVGRMLYAACLDCPGVVGIAKRPGAVQPWVYSGHTAGSPVGSTQRQSSFSSHQQVSPQIASQSMPGPSSEQAGRVARATAARVKTAARNRAVLRFIEGLRG